MTNRGLANSNWAASSEFGTYRLCEQWRFRRACASAQSRQNLRCSLIQAVSQEEPSNRKPDPWPLWMAGHAQLKFVMTECSKTQIRLTRHNWWKYGYFKRKHNNRNGHLHVLLFYFIDAKLSWLLPGDATGLFQLILWATKLSQF